MLFLRQVHCFLCHLAYGASLPGPPQPVAPTAPSWTRRQPVTLTARMWHPPSPVRPDLGTGDAHGPYVASTVTGSDLGVSPSSYPGRDACLQGCERLRAGWRPAEGDRGPGPGCRSGRPVPDVARHHRQRQVGHHRLDHRGRAEAHARHRAQQVPRRPVGQRVQGVLPRQSGRVLRLLLRLLPARGLHPLERHLHREGLVHQRRDRPPAPQRHLRPARETRRDRGGQRVVHLRPGVARGVRHPGSSPPAGGGAPSAGHPRPPGRHAVRAQRRQLRPGQVPGAGRHDRGLPRLRRDRCSHRAVRRRGGAHQPGRPPHRRAHGRHQGARRSSPPPTTWPARRG